MAYSKLTSEKIEVLREIGNIGAGNATTALSVMLNSNLRMQIPEVKLYEFDELPQLMGGPDTIVTAVLTSFVGDVNGMVFFLLDLEEAKALAGKMLSKTYTDDFIEFDHMDKSVLKEIGNILMSSYVSSLSTLTGLNLRTEPPAISIDMAGAIFDLPISVLGQIDDRALIVDSKFIEDDKLINGFLMFVTDEMSFEKIFKSLGVAF